ncbi:MAG: GIY-YIG nuclease family protein [Chloroflexi bacterium]|nr:GIY-YIG nuclease family protein [Chloroflexota bacterium]
MRSRTIRIHLREGNPAGILSAEIGNATIKVTVVSKTRLKDVADEIKCPGVYFLVGDNPDNPAKPMVYVGESDNLLERLTYHYSAASMYYWERTIIVTSKDDNFTKAHVMYLEAKLVQAISQAQRALLKNGRDPDIPTLPAADKADMNEFLEQTQLLLPVLGFQFASLVPTMDVSADNFTVAHGKPSIIPPIAESPMLHLSYAGVSADARVINGEVIVFKGSTFRKQTTSTIPHYDVDKRSQLENDGKLAEGADPDYWTLKQDVSFNSISAAARAIGGASLNGRDVWKIKDSDQTYGEWQEAQRPS